MASGILVNIKEEVTCPICLELLTEPRSLDCGHTFCQACITANNKESLFCKKGKISCPVCRITYKPRNLRPNWHVANIVEKLKEAKLSPEEEQNTDLCERHGKKLLLFCKEDGMVICWLCERSQEHRGHHTFLMEEVAQEYEEKLQAALDRLMAEDQEAEELEAYIEAQRISWKNLIQNERQIVQDYFKNLRGILDSEEQKELQKLKKEEGDALRDLEQSESELVQQNLVLRDLMSELEHRLQGSMRKMLQDVNGIMERSKTFTLKKSVPVFREQRTVFQAPDLNEMLQALNELTDVRRYWVHITLDPPKDKANVAVSEDRRQVRYEHRLDANKDASAVLGSPVITSGKHYWEADVSKKQAWSETFTLKKPKTVSKDQRRVFQAPDLSEMLQAFNDLTDKRRYWVHITLDPPKDKANVVVSEDRRQVRYEHRLDANKEASAVLGLPVITSGKHYWEVDVSKKQAWYLGVCVEDSDTSSLQPKDRSWVIGLENKFEYYAYVASSSSDPWKLTLSLTVPPRRVGIFLDYDAHTVSFYNITNHRLLIYKFSCSFPQKIYPCFSPETCTVPMTLCSPGT